MVDFYQQIRELEDKLKKVYYLFKKTSQKVENLKSQNTQEIQQKENELIGLKSDLEICQQEKLDISQKLNEAIEELANSNLTGQEKIAQIIKLTTENQKHFDKVNGYLDSAWKSYGEIQSKINQVLINEIQNGKNTDEKLTKISQRQLITNIFSGVSVGFTILYFLISKLKNIKKKYQNKSFNKGFCQGWNWGEKRWLIA